ncbi:MAG: hypothetical protein NC240_10505 [Clostridium sp.]|nr:hypothetical protein [Clostridium sp.]
MNTFLFGIFQIFKKPWVFLITTAMLAIGLAVSFYSFIVYDSYHYPTRQAEKALSYDINHVYKINFGIAMLGLNTDDFDKISELYDKIGDIKDVECHGGYFFHTNGKKNKLYLVPSLAHLCNLRNAENKPIDFAYDGGEGEYGKAYVGMELSGEYPVGSVFYDEETDCEYMIADVIREDSLWLPDDVYGDSAVNLNNAILLDLKYATGKPGNGVYLFNACNHLLIASDNPDIKDELLALCENLEININGVLSLGTMYLAYEKEAMDRAGENYLLPLVLLLSAMIVCVITSKMSIMAGKRDYGIMISNGFTKVNIIGMALTENIIKCVCAFTACMLYWQIQYMKMDDFTRILYKDMSVFRICLFLIILIIACEFPVRYLLRSEPLDLINRVEL